MGNRIVALNQNNVSLRIRILDDLDGTPATGVVAATAGQEIWYQRGWDNAVQTDAGSAANMSAITNAHVNWEFIHIREGWYRVDFPDAAFAAGVGSVICGINATGFTGVSTTIDIGPFKFQGTPSGVTSVTTTFPAGSNPYIGDSILAVEGTGIGGEVLITSVSGQIATHAAFPVGISATTTTVLLIPGYAQLVNLNATVSSRSVLDTGDLANETANITALLPATLTTAGNMKSGIEEVNDIEVVGDGQTGTEWNPI